MGEVDDPHHAEDENEAYGNKRHVARGIGRVHDGLQEKLSCHRKVPRSARTRMLSGHCYARLARSAAFFKSSMRLSRGCGKMRPRGRILMPRLKSDEPTCAGST